MAELKINGRTTVRKLKADFKAAFGSSLRVYMAPSCKGRMADDAATLASIRAEGAKGGELKATRPLEDSRPSLLRTGVLAYR